MQNFVSQKLWQIFDKAFLYNVFNFSFLMHGNKCTLREGADYNGLITKQIVMKGPSLSF